MRSTMSWVAVLIVAGTGVFGWQRSQIVRLRAQVTQQQSALEDNQRRVEDLAVVLNGAGRRSAHATGLRESSLGTKAIRAPDGPAGGVRADERRLILDQYRDVIAQMNLPGETADRLGNLLTDRVEAVLDAEDAAKREGFAEGSAETARAVAMAIAEVDRDIFGLVGQDGMRRISGFPAVAPEPVLVPAQPATATTVTVVVQQPPVEVYEEAAPAQPDAYAPYASYVYFPVAGLVRAARAGREFAGVRTHHPVHNFPLR